VRAPETPLDELLAATPRGDGRYDVELPEGWHQGRGIFGGLVTGLMVRTFEHFRSERPLRSLTAELCGPAQAGPATLELTALRDGSTVSTVTARLVQGGEVQAHGVGVLGGDRATAPDRVFGTAPTLTDWRTLEPIPVAPPFGPEFARQWDFRADTLLPFSGQATAATEGWIRPRHPGARRDAAFLATCADAWWPSLFSVDEAPRPMATIAFTFQPVGDFAGLDPAAPLAYRARAEVVRHGYVVELRELWGEDGRLLALNQQTFCVIK
jgi:hypothetical protein